MSVEMAAYNDGCVFVNPNTEVADCTAIVHEFGHFNHMYRVRANSFYAPIPLSMCRKLCRRAWASVLRPLRRTLPWVWRCASENTTVRQASCGTRGFAINEAGDARLLRASLTVDKVDAIWTEAYEKYSWPADENEWLDVAPVHLAVLLCRVRHFCACRARFVRGMRSDYAAAVDTYLRLSELAPETTYCQALREASLPNYLEKAR